MNFNDIRSVPSSPPFGNDISINALNGGESLGNISYGKSLGLASFLHDSTEVVAKPSNPRRPKRPLTAYNLFFRSERAKLVGESAAVADDKHRPKKRKRQHRKTHGKIAFVELARTIGRRWNQLDSGSRLVFEAKAFEDRKRYADEMEQYRQALLAAKKRENNSRCAQKTRSPTFPHQRLSNQDEKSSTVLHGTNTNSNSNIAPDQYCETLTKSLKICDPKLEEKVRFPHSEHGTAISDLEKELTTVLGEEMIDFLLNLSEDEAPTSASEETTINSVSFRVVRKSETIHDCDLEQNRDEGGDYPFR